MNTAHHLISDLAKCFNSTLELQGRAERLNVNLVIGEERVNDQPDQDQGNGRTFHGLSVLTLPMSSRVGVEQLSIIRDEYYRSLMNSKFNVRKNNKLQDESFSDVDAVQMTNLFFNDLIGPEALKRIANIIKHYNRPDNGVARRAEKLSYAADIPLEEVREFFHAYSKAQRAQNGTGSVFFKMQRTVWGLELLQHLTRLRQMARDKHPDLLMFLRDRNYHPERGVSWVSVVLRFLAESLVLDRIALRNTFQAAYGTAELVEHYGLGIIPILPSNASKK